MHGVARYTLFLLLFSFSSSAQDASFSQYYLNPLHTNPANTGINPGLRMNMNHRSLWLNIPSVFPTFSLSADAQLPHIASGIGMNVYRDVEGEGYLHTQSFGGYYSYMAELDPKRWYFNAGFNTALVSKRIDWSKLVFSDQIDPVLGVVKPSASPAPTFQSVVYPDFNVGWVLRHVQKNRRRGLTLTYNLGFALHHLVKPNESIWRMSSPLPRRYVAHADVLIPFKTDLKSHKRYLVNPMVMWEYQEPMRTFLVSTIALISPVYVGLGYRNQTPAIPDIKHADAMVVTFGLNDILPNRDIYYKVGYSYDLTISDLKSNTHGSHELALVIENRKFSLSRNKSRKKFECSSF